MHMSMTAIIINIFTLGCLILAFLKDSSTAKKALIHALKGFLRILPMVIVIIIIIGLLLGVVSKETISKIVGKQAGFWGIASVALLGALLHIPSLVSFPMAAALLNKGASVTSVVVFITTLTMIGVVTLPLEIKELGKRLALWRNGLSFIIAIIIGIIMGVIL